MLNELDIVMRENACPHIVQFYGALFKEVSGERESSPVRNFSLSLCLG